MRRTGRQRPIRVGRDGFLSIKQPANKLTLGVVGRIDDIGIVMVIGHTDECSEAVCSRPRPAIKKNAAEPTAFFMRQ